jgi:ATP-dependent Lhr-like helicase
MLVESLAWQLLRRYGVVFRRLVERESLGAPWRDVLRVFRRLEARGEIRGGRFVNGFSGEQYALPEAIGSLRAVRRDAPSGELVAVSGADPLNLVGIITPGEPVAALATNRVLYRDGVPVAVKAGEGGKGKGDRLLVAATPAEAHELETALVRRRPGRDAGGGARAVHRGRAPPAGATRQGLPRQDPLTGPLHVRTGTPTG